MQIKLRNKQSSRHQIDIRSIENDTLTLGDGNLRAILSTNSLNFELKSEEEQDVILDNYQSFLNSLPCKIQILIRIKSLDIDNYLNNFRDIHENENNFKEHIDNYCDFVKSHARSNKLLTRLFYVVVATEISEDRDNIKEKLSLNIDLVSKQLNKLGIHTSRLTTIDIINLFYGFYSEVDQKIQPITKHTLAGGIL